MKHVIMLDKGVRFHFTVRDEPPPFPVDLEASIEELRASQEAKQRPQEFLTWWRKEMEQRKLTFVPSPEMYRIVRHLLKSHTRTRLQELAVDFFRHHADALYEGTYDRSLILFASKIGTMEDLRGE